MSAPHCPPPGIYYDVDFQTYLGWQAISNSSLQAALRSMRHYKYQQPVEESPEMRLGTLCHVGKFEPLMIARRYVVMPDLAKNLRKPNGDEYDKPRSTAAYRELVAEFSEQHKDQIVVEQAMFDRMIGMVDALAKNERANKYLAVDADTKVEVAIVWNDPDTGLACKGRVDCIKPKMRIASDLKTSRDVERFDRVIYDRSYHRQGAFYCDGLEHLTGDQYWFSITAVENFAPYGVRSAPLSDDAMDLGREEYKRLLKQIAEARKTNVWPCYEDPFEWNVPAWAQKSDEPLELVIGGEKVSM